MNIFYRKLTAILLIIGYFFQILVLTMPLTVRADDWGDDWNTGVAQSTYDEKNYPTVPQSTHPKPSSASSAKSSNSSGWQHTTKPETNKSVTSTTDDAIFSESKSNNNLATYNTPAVDASNQWSDEWLAQQSIQSNASKTEPPSNTVVPTDNSSQSYSLNSNTLGLTGPLSVGGTYDSLVGGTVNGLFAHKLSEATAIALLGEYGPDQYRMSGTTGFQMYPEGRLKLTAEYLNQTLPFNFDSGDIDEAVSQTAYGFDFEHKMNQSLLRDLTVGGYYAKAPNVSLETLNFIADDGLEYENQRNLAGATSEGMDFGAHLKMSPTTMLDAKLYYDSVEYNTEFTESSTYDTSGLGVGVQLDQLINDSAKISLSGEVRQIYDTFGLSLDFAPNYTKNLGMTFSLTASEVISSNETPDSTSVGLQVNFLSDNPSKKSYYTPDGVTGFQALDEWVKTPAVYMQRVMIIAEQITTLAAPHGGAITPAFGDLSGGNTVTITGSNFAPGIEVLFGALAGTVTVVSSTELSVVVPEATSTGAVSVTLTNTSGRNTVLSDAYTYVEELPLLTDIAPSSGPLEGGQLVVLSGTNFTYVDSVKFGILSATIISKTDTSISVTTPSSASSTSQTVDVTAISTSGDNSTLQSAYTYQAAPVVSNITPNEGSNLGQVPVVISGSNFVGATAVYFGTTLATSSYTINEAGTSISLLAPAGSNGVVNVTVVTPSGTSNSSVTYQFVSPGPPEISSISPSSGPTSGGTEVTVNGIYFSDVSSVTFNGVNAVSYTVVNDSVITAFSPVNASGTVDLVVTGHDHLTASTTYTYVAKPVALAISPSEGATTGGTSVTIAGANLSDSTVYFGSVAGTVTTMASSAIAENVVTSITVTSPEQDAGIVPVRIVSVGGTSRVVPSMLFTYVTPPTVTSVSPTSGSIDGGLAVTISGTNLDNATAVYFGDIEASFAQSNSVGDITATSPASTVSGNVNVTVVTSGGTSASSDANIFNYVSVPTVSDLSPSPAQGPVTGGTEITLTGTDLLTTSEVTFGSVSTTDFTVNDAGTLLTVTSPANTLDTGFVNVTVTTEGGDVIAPQQFEYIVVPTVALTSPTPAQGSVAGGTTVVLTGSNLSTTSSVSFGSSSTSNFTVNSSGTEITVTSPPSTASGAVSISVTTIGGVATASQTFEYVGEPAELTLVSPSPAQGSTNGGTTVTIMGTNLATTSSISFGSVATTNFTVNSEGNTITVTSPANNVDVGLVNVSVTTVGGTVTASPQFNYIPPPTINLTTPVPAEGPTTGETTVILTGTNLSTASSVSFGSTVTTNFTIDSATQITVITPSHDAGAVAVSVTTVGGSASASQNFTYVSAPSISAISPSGGPAGGGTTVTITGSNLTGASVTFGSTVVATQSNDASSLVVISPNLPAGVVTVTVTTSGGSATTSYVYASNADSMDVTSGPVAGGTAVTITGTGLTGSTVTFGGAVATIVSTSDTEINLTTPGHVAGAVPVIVTTGGVPRGLDQQYTYVALPTISSISPSSDYTSGNSLVTIAGTNLQGSTVTFNGVSISTQNIASDGTSLTVYSPAGSAGTVTVAVTTAGGVASTSFTYVGVPTLSSVISATSGNNTGSITGGYTVTLTGTNFLVSPAVTPTVKFGSTAATSVAVTSSTTITAVAPSSTGGNVNVTVTTGSGTSTETVSFYYLFAISGLSPTSGSTLGGTALTITGIGFTNASAVNFGTNVNASSFSIVSDTQITTTTPAYPYQRGPIDVAVIVGSEAATSSNAEPTALYFTYYDPPPTITSVSPSSGPTSGGAANNVTITGTYLKNLSTVYFGSNYSSSFTTSDLSVVATPPAANAGTVNVVVTNDSNQYSGDGVATATNAYTYVALPTIANFSPLYGTSLGGDTVTINGTNFVSGGTTVKFGSASGSSVNVISSEQLTVVTPVNTGTQQVSVTTTGGTAVASGTFEFKSYPTVTAISPSSGSTSGEETVTITGSNLDQTIDVTFAGYAATVVSKSSGSVTVTTPVNYTQYTSSPNSVDVVLTTSVGSTTATNAYSYVSGTPTISEFTPESSPIDSTTTVEIEGTNLAGATDVFFGDVSATFNVNSPTSITVSVPESVTETSHSVYISVAVAGVSVTASSPFYYTAPAPIVNTISPSSGDATKNQAITISGKYFTGATAVKLGTVSATDIVVLDDETITAKTPTGTAGTTAVVYVTTPIGTNETGPSYLYLGKPYITSISPNSAKKQTAISLTGTSFTGTTTIKFEWNAGANSGSSVTVNSDTSISSYSPSDGSNCYNYPGNAAKVSVTNAYGTSNKVDFKCNY